MTEYIMINDLDWRDNELLGVRDMTPMTKDEFDEFIKKLSSIYPVRLTGKIDYRTIFVKDRRVHRYQIRYSGDISLLFEDDKEPQDNRNVYPEMMEDWFNKD